MLIAARDIKAGEVVFRDSPAAIGADNNPGPICLHCFKRLTSKNRNHLTDDDDDDDDCDNDDDPDSRSHLQMSPLQLASLWSSVSTD